MNELTPYGLAVSAKLVKRRKLMRCPRAGDERTQANLRLQRLWKSHVACRRLKSDLRSFPCLGSRRPGSSAEPPRVSRQRDWRHGDPASTWAAPFFSAQCPEPVPQQPLHDNVAAASKNQPRSIRGLLFPGAHGTEQGSPSHLVNGVGYRHRDPEQPTVAARRARVRQGQECDMRICTRSAVRAVSAQPLGDGVGGMVENGGSQRRCDFYRSIRREGARIIGELENDPVARSVRTTYASCFVLVANVVRVLVSHIREGQSSRLDALVLSMTPLQLGDLSSAHVAKSCGTKSRRH